MGNCHQYKREPDSKSSFKRNNENLLYILTTFYNPAQFSRRIQLHKEFISRLSHLKTIVVITVECAFENQPFQVTSPYNEPYDIQVRSSTRLWLKECLMNIGLNKLKKDATFNKQCKYVAWVDDDIEFSDPLFLLKLERSLETYSIVQLFSKAYFLDINENLLETFTSFGYYYADRKMKLKEGEYPHPGFAWCTTKDNIMKMKEFYDKGILGNGDKHMANALIGRYEKGFYPGFEMSKGYKESLRLWQEDVRSIFQLNVGYVDTEIRHHWHGAKNDRQYILRWKLLLDFNYDPFENLIKEHGIYRLKEDKKDFNLKILEFFKGRKEDETKNEEYEDEKIPCENKIERKLEKYFKTLNILPKKFSI